MIKNNDEAYRAFDIMMDTKNRISSMEYTLHHLDNEDFIPFATLSIAADFRHTVRVPLNKDQIRGQLTRESSDLSADLRDQAKELGAFFGL